MRNTLFAACCWSVASVAVAHAEVDPQVEAAAQLGAAMAPGAKRHAAAPLKGTNHADWYPPALAKGQCYWFAAAATGSRGLFLYLFDPQNRKVAVNEARQPRAVVGFCPDLPGAYHLEARGDGSSFAVVTYSRKGKFGELNQDGTPNQSPPSAASASTAPGAPPCNDNGDHGGNASFVVGCDCGAMEVYLDGQLHNFQSGNGRFDGQFSGCHTLKVVAWTSPFSRKTWYDGQVKLVANHESRFQVNKAGLSLVGKTPIQAPRPPVDTSGLNDARDIVGEAIERNREEDLACGARFDQRLIQLADLIGIAAAGATPANVDQAIRRTQDSIESADEDCSRRVGRTMDKKLRRVLDRLKAVRHSM